MTATLSQGCVFTHWHICPFFDPVACPMGTEFGDLGGITQTDRHARVVGGKIAPIIPGASPERRARGPVDGDLVASISRFPLLSNIQSYPIQDQPEGEVCFQHKMSLKVSGTKGYKLLVNDDHHAEPRAACPGRDPGVPGRQSKHRLGQPRAGADLSLSRACLGGAALPTAWQGGRRAS